MQAHKKSKDAVGSNLPGCKRIRRDSKASVGMEPMQPFSNSHPWGRHVYRSLAPWINISMGFRASPERRFDPAPRGYLRIHYKDSTRVGHLEKALSQG